MLTFQSNHLMLSKLSMTKTGLRSIMTRMKTTRMIIQDQTQMGLRETMILLITKKMMKEVHMVQAVIKTKDEEETLAQAAAREILKIEIKDKGTRIAETRIPTPSHKSMSQSSTEKLVNQT
jgi:hypothetical protein